MSPFSGGETHNNNYYNGIQCKIYGELNNLLWCPAYHRNKLEYKNFYPFFFFSKSISLYDWKGETLIKASFSINSVIFYHFIFISLDFLQFHLLRLLECICYEFHVTKLSGILFCVCGELFVSRPAISYENRNLYYIEKR